MWLIISLIIIGALLLVAEIVLLPGISIAGIGGFIAYGIAIYLGFVKYDTSGGLIIIGVIIAISILSIALSVRARTWQKLALKNSIDSTSQPLPHDQVGVGDKGVTITRLNPVGKVLINQNTYEAKSLGDAYVDPRQEIEVVGFENFNIVVKPAGKYGSLTEERSEK